MRYSVFLFPDWAKTFPLKCSLFLNPASETLQQQPIWRRIWYAGDCEALFLNEKQTEGNWTFDIASTTGTEKQYRVIIAAYDDSKSLAKADLKTVSVQDLVNAYSGTFTIPQEAVKVKMFVWDAVTLAPVFEAIEYNLPCCKWKSLCRRWWNQYCILRRLHLCKRRCFSFLQWFCTSAFTVALKIPMKKKA